MVGVIEAIIIVVRTKVITVHTAAMAAALVEEYSKQEPIVCIAFMVAL